MKKVNISILFVTIFFLTTNIFAAEETKPKTLEAIEFLSGWGKAKLNTKQNYRVYPLLIDFDFNLKPAFKKIGFEPKQLLQFQIEPFFSVVSQPEMNIETSTSFFLKSGIFPRDWKFQPFFKLGAGINYMSQHIREQSTQFNFIEQGVIGFHYFFRKNTAFTVEGRARHLSNAGIKQPNHGINTYFAVAGLSYNF